LANATSYNAAAAGTKPQHKLYGIWAAVVGGGTSQPGGVASPASHLQLMGSQSQKLLTACSFLISDLFSSTTRRTFFVLATVSAFYRARATRSS
jgi:hypothetical protein